MLLSTVLHSRLCEKTLVERSERSSGFSTEVGEVSNYHQGKLTVLSLLSWPRSLYGVYIEHKSSISLLRRLWCQLLTLQHNFINTGTPKFGKKKLEFGSKVYYCCIHLRMVFMPTFSLQGNPWWAYQPALRSYWFGMSHDHSFLFYSFM